MYGIRLQFSAQPTGLKTGQSQIYKFREDFENMLTYKYTLNFALSKAKMFALLGFLH